MFDIILLLQCYAKKNGKTLKFCRICKVAGKNATMYESHTIGSCSYLTDRDWQDLKTALRSVELGAGEAEDVLEPFLEPGWDDLEGEED